MSITRPNKYTNTAASGLFSEELSTPRLYAVVLTPSRIIWELIEAKESLEWAVYSRTPFADREKCAAQIRDTGEFA